MSSPSMHPALMQRPSVRLHCCNQTPCSYCLKSTCEVSVLQTALLAVFAEHESKSTDVFLEGCVQYVKCHLSPTASHEAWSSGICVEVPGRDAGSKWTGRLLTSLSQSADYTSCSYLGLIRDLAESAPSITFIHSQMNLEIIANSSCQKNVT